MTAYFSLIETDLIRQGIDAHPEVAELLSLTPKYLLERIDPMVAAIAIADGLESRAHRIVTPRRWRPMFAMQGVAGPVADRKNARTPAMHAALTSLETRDLSPATRLGASARTTTPREDVHHDVEHHRSRSQRDSPTWLHGVSRPSAVEPPRATSRHTVPAAAASATPSSAGRCSCSTSSVGRAVSRVR